jgi:hypothetical protein
MVNAIIAIAFVKNALMESIVYHVSVDMIYYQENAFNVVVIVKHQMITVNVIVVMMNII